MTEESSSEGNWLTQFESSLLTDESHIHNEERLEEEKCVVNGKLWTSFQNCATSIAKVYVERESQRGADAFRSAARDATLLYKDGVEMSIKLSDMAMNSGYNRRNKEILQWAKKRRRFIRREELIAFLCSPLQSSQHQQPNMVQGQGQTTRKSLSLDYDYDDDNKHLDTFREAIQSSTPQENQSQLTLIQPQQPPNSTNRKRSTSPLDINMSSCELSPSHRPRDPKRLRFHDEYY